MEEFKHIIKVNIAKTACDSVNKEKTAQIKLLTEASTAQDSAIAKQKEIIDLQEKHISDITPPWYDKFYIGSVTTIIVTLVILLIPH